VPSTGWTGLGDDPQHTGVSANASQPTDAIHWQTSVDQNVTGSAVHYGSPVVTAANTVIYPVKTGATGGFEVQARDGATGTLKWTLPTDYTLPSFNWLPPYQPTLTPSGRLYFPGNGGTVYYVDNPDTPNATVGGQLAFYGLQNYQNDPTSFNNTVFINTPITSDAQGNIYFGFVTQGTAPMNLVSGVARIGADGSGTWVPATIPGDPNVSIVPNSCAPALSNDGKTVYVGFRQADTSYHGYLVGLDSTTLALKEDVFLQDPRNNGNGAGLLTASTATPMVAPDGTVFYGVFGNPYNGSRGFLLHFSADLSQEFTPGAFGWDDTPSVIPASMVPSYHGTSSYLIFSKYNNYADITNGGNGVNRIAVLDPYASQPDPNNDGTNMPVMREILSIAGPTPDADHTANNPDAVHEWCINDTAVDPFNKCVVVNSEDGNVYRWDLTSNTLTDMVNITPGVGEPYTPTVIGTDGTVYAINGGTLFALGALQSGYTMTNASNGNPTVPGQLVTYATSLASTNGGAVPTGTITYQDAINGVTTPLGSQTLVNGQASLGVSFPGAGNYFVSAVYSGDPNYQGGTITLVQGVRQPASVALASSGSPSVFGQPVTFTATVTGANATPTGIVAFLDGSTYLGDVTLSGGQASLTVSSLSVGSHNITATYSGDYKFAGSSSTLSQSVSLDGTSTGLTSSADPSSYGQSVTFTATVTASAPGAGVPTGTVKFKATGTSSTATVTLDSTGKATLNVATLPVGTTTFTAVYSGDGNFTTSTSAGLAQTVNVAQTQTILTSSLNPSNVGQSVTFTATVTAVAPGAGVPGGRVVFRNGSKTLGTVSLNSQGQASITVRPNKAGSYNITASYGGSTNHYAASTSAVLVQVVNAPVGPGAVVGLPPSGSLPPPIQWFNQRVIAAGGTPADVTAVDGLLGGDLARLDELFTLLHNKKGEPAWIAG
jgi:hypothetical protein